MLGESITLWTVRLSFVCFVLALGCWLTDSSGRSRRLTRGFWTIGCAFNWLHTLAAYHFAHQWNHAEAVAHVERQSEQLIGISVGWGIYFNWCFGIAWTIDCAIAWRTPSDQGWRTLGPARIALLCFMIFMWINGAIVFADGAIRWVATLSFLVLGIMAIRRLPMIKNHRQSQTPSDEAER